MPETKSLISTSGRRKTSVACVNLAEGTGLTKINGSTLDDYFVTPGQRIEALRPLFITETQKRFDIQVRASGGGLTGQAGATSLAIARALVEYNADFRAPLKREGLLTRDSRAKERKKSGQPGARKRFQFSKR